VRFRFWFGSDTSSQSYPGAYVDEFSFEESPLNDLGVISIDAPTGSNQNLTATEAVTVTVENFGIVAQSNIPVSVTVTNPMGVPTTLNEVIAGPIMPGTTMAY